MVRLSLSAGIYSWLVATLFYTKVKTVTNLLTNLTRRTATSLIESNAFILFYSFVKLLNQPHQQIVFKEIKEIANRIKILVVLCF